MILKKGRWPSGRRWSTNTSRCHPPSLSRGAWSSMFIHAWRKYCHVLDDRFHWYLHNNSHPSITVSRARHDESTGNLKRHVKNCSPADSGQTQAIANYASGSKYTQARHRLNIALWVANCYRPFSIVQDEELLRIFTELNPNCVTPSRHTVSRDVKEIFAISRKEVGELLRVCVVLSYLWFMKTQQWRNRFCLEISRQTPYCCGWMDFAQRDCIYWCNCPLGGWWQDGQCNTRFY